MKNPYESTSVCKVTQLTTEVSLNFWARWRTAGPGGCELLGAACWRIRRTWTSHRFWSPPLVRPSQWRCAPLKSCWWSQTDIKVSTRGCGVWLMQSHRFLVFTRKLAWTRFKMPQHKIAHWNLIVCRLGASITGGFYNTQRHPISHDVELKINYLLFPAIRASPRIVQLRCAYEAYLAQEEGKTILIAHSSHFPEILAALPLMATAAVLGVALGFASAFLRVGGPYGGSVLAILLVAVSLVVQDENCRRMMHLLGQMLCWVQMIHMAGWVVKNEAGTAGKCWNADRCEVIVGFCWLGILLSNSPTVLEYSNMVRDKTLPVVWRISTSDMCGHVTTLVRKVSLLKWTTPCMCATGSIFRSPSALWRWIESRRRPLC